LKGKVIIHQHESNILKSNPLKDPYKRDVIVYLPPDYTPSDSSGYVTVFGLVGFGGRGKMLLNEDPFEETIEERMNRLISTNKKCGPMLIVLVDCFTKLGGNQYINSSATGMYEDYILNEIVPFIDENYNCSFRALFGHSSGGYGSIILAMRHPEIFQGFASHSGDSGFEYCYLPDFPKALNVFIQAGGPAKWFDNFWKKPNRHQQNDMVALNVMAMAAHYSPNPNSKETMGIDFPFNLQTGEILQDVWNRWLSWDPTRLVEKYHSSLERLKVIYIDCGTKDEFNLQWGTRVLHSKLEKMNIRHFYHEFDNGHQHINYRYDISLPVIYDALTSSS
jgi:enterochelin esterase-like enzyme